MTRHTRSHRAKSRARLGLATAAALAAIAFAAALSDAFWPSVACGVGAFVACVYAVFQSCELADARLEEGEAEEQGERQ